MSKIGFVSLGCPKNLVDSEVMMGLLENNSHQLTTEKNSADIIVVNTCGFIDAAKQESIDTILEMAQYKQTGQCQKLIVTGCLVERYRQELQEEIPEIDALLGTNEVEEILQACNSTSKISLRRSLPVIAPSILAETDNFIDIVGQTPKREEDIAAAAYLYNDKTPRKRTTPKFYSYIKISEGCEHPCTFCIIPKLRGDFRSRRLGSILKEAEILAKQGVKELVLIAQDSTWYGQDLGIKDGLATLLKSLASVDGIEWIRFLYSYPSRLSNAVLDVMAQEPKLCNYVDIPLQHASTKMLKAMKRPGNREFVEKLVMRMRQRVPKIAIRTTFIVGFPGETEDDFQELMEFCKQMEFDNLGVFTYSDEEGTPAYEMENKVPLKTAQARQRKLMKQQAQISRRHNKKMIGQRVKVLFEGESKESDLLWQGRMESQAPEIDGCILINDAPENFSMEPGTFVTVEITEAHDYDLIGRIV
ncbi:MAG: 30S ribosomal protein S12 methylthiotransferase RimO [Acidobacteria bacterium]|nr:30S ribosomal protein S12 methylthiotransferase RimO [Acidobacteriota bacterium]